MNETRVLCDVEGCNKPGAIRQSFFKERLADGAGSMENWHYTFDLCPLHIAAFLSAIFESIERSAFTLESALRFTSGFKIKTRVG